MEFGGQVHTPAAFILEEISATPSKIHRIGDWLDSTALQIRQIFPSRESKQKSYVLLRAATPTLMKGFRSKSLARYSTSKSANLFFRLFLFFFTVQKWIHTHTLTYTNNLELGMYRTLRVFLNCRQRMSKRPRFNCMSPYSFSH